MDMDKSISSRDLSFPILMVLLLDDGPVGPSRTWTLVLSMYVTQSMHRARRIPSESWAAPETKPQWH